MLIKLAILAVLISLNGCAVLTPATPSLTAYLAAHAGGVATVSVVTGSVITAEQLYLNTEAIVKK